MEYSFKQDDVVEIADAYGFGRVIQAIVKGVASMPQAEIGASYIVKPVGKVFDKETYPYSHFVVFEIHMTRVEK